MYQAATQRLANWLSLWYIFHIGKLHHNFLLICKIVSFSNSSYIANYQKISSQFGTIGKNHIQSSSSFSQNCSFCLLWIWYFPTFLMNYTMNHITEQAFFFLFAIHLPPVEDGEFLLYIMLNFTTRPLICTKWEEKPPMILSLCIWVTM
mgnify:CR=1 FL=1